MATIRGLRHRVRSRIRSRSKETTMTAVILLFGAITAAVVALNWWAGKRK
jgi:hypothetical protein